jgi:hypothetical protein
MKEKRVQKIDDFFFIKLYFIFCEEANINISCIYKKKRKKNARETRAQHIGISP